MVLRVLGVAAISGCILPPDSQHPITAGTRADRIDALVICNDDSLLIELGALLGDRYRVHAVDTLANLGGQVRIDRWIGIVDAESQAGAHGAISRLETQHPGCPLIVITEHPAEWADSIARGSVLAAIGRDQIGTTRLSQALQAAERRLLTDGVGAQDAPRSSSTGNRFVVSPLRRHPVWAGAAVLLVVLGVTGSWLYHRYAVRTVTVGANIGANTGANIGTNNGASTVPAGAQTGDAASSQALNPFANRQQGAPDRQQNVLELLSAARVAFREKRLLPQPEGELRGDSALELYVQVLSQDPQNDEALAGVQRLLVLGRARITTDAASGKLDDASRLLGLFEAARLDAGDLQPLASAISAARPKWLAQRAAQDIAAGDFRTAEQLLAQAVASGADATTVRALRTQEAAKKLALQLTAMAKQVERAVQAGALLPPAVDNALSRLAAMRSLGRSHPLTVQAQYEVQAALVQAGEQATRAAQFALAQRDLSAAAQLGSFAPLSYARRQLQEAKAAAAERATALALAAAQQAKVATARVPAAATSAAAASAPAVAAPPPRPYIAARPTRALPLSYPSGVDANGSVVVEFTLSANGVASDVTVVQSDPPGVFDRAAISAVLGGRYSTRELVDGQPARARIKLRFDSD